MFGLAEKAGAVPIFLFPRSANLKRHTLIQSVALFGSRPCLKYNLQKLLVYLEWFTTIQGLNLVLDLIEDWFGIFPDPVK